MSCIILSLCLRKRNSSHVQNAFGFHMIYHHIWMVIFLLSIYICRLPNYYITFNCSINYKYYDNWPYPTIIHKHDLCSSKWRFSLLLSGVRLVEKICLIRFDNTMEAFLAGFDVNSSCPFLYNWRLGVQGDSAFAPS